MSRVPLSPACRGPEPAHGLKCDGGPFYAQNKKKLKLAKELSDMVVYCKSVHFNGFADARDNLSFYEMSSFKEGKALELAEESGTTDSGLGRLEHLKI